MDMDKLDIDIFFGDTEGQMKPQSCAKGYVVKNNLPDYFLL